MTHTTLFLTKYAKRCKIIRKKDKKVRLEMRNTRQKKAIFDAVQGLTTHPTAEELYNTLKLEHEKLSLGTVYRNLNTFSSDGKIKKIPVPGFSDRYDFNTCDHEHFICTECGRVFDAMLDRPLCDIVIQEGLTITEYNLILYGFCDSCNSAKQAM